MVPAEGGGRGVSQQLPGRTEPSITTAPPASPQPPHRVGAHRWQRVLLGIMEHDGSAATNPLPSRHVRCLFGDHTPPSHPPLHPPSLTPTPPPAASRCSFGTRCPGCALTVPHGWALWGIRTPILALSSKHRHPRSASPPRMPPTRTAPRPTRTVSCGVAARRSRIPPGAPSSPARGGCGHGGRCVRGWAAPPRARLLPPLLPSWVG